MENKRSIEYYESRVRDVKLEDITSNGDNARMLQQLRDNHPDFTSINLTNSASPYYDFVVSDNDDLGWLGYFIGRNSQLKSFNVFTWLEGDTNHSKIDALAQGFSLNRSISDMTICAEWGDFFLQRLGNFLTSNKNLTKIGLVGSEIGLETARKLAVDLRDMSLESLLIGGLCYDSNSDTFIDEGVVTADVITALSTHTKLESLDLLKCNLDRSSCKALGRLSCLKELNFYASNVDVKGMKALADDLCCCLESLELSHIGYEDEKEVVALSSGLAGLHSLKKLKLRKSIGDNTLQFVVAAIANISALEVLDLSQNTSITAKGLSSLSSLLQSDKCCLRELVLHGMHIGDDGAAALAEALAGNKSLKGLKFYDSSTSDHVATGITATGSSAFTRLLCDTSSINNTYLSNHTLEWFDTSYADRMTKIDFDYYLSVNRKDRYAAMHKILKNYPEFDMKPLFQWQLKFLPLIVAWIGLARAREDLMSLSGMAIWRERSGGSQRRELSAIYQFVRGLPLLTVAGWRNQKMTGTESKKRKFDRL